MGFFPNFVVDTESYLHDGFQSAEERMRIVEADDSKISKVHL